MQKLIAMLIALALSWSAEGTAASELGRRIIDVLEEFRQQGNPIAYSATLVPQNLTVTIEPIATASLQKVLEVLRPHQLTLETVEGVFVVVPLGLPPDATARPRAAAFDPSPLESITVSASRYELDRDAASSSVSIGQHAIEEMPDIGSDPTRVSHRLPGVAASGASARAHFRGGESNEIGIILNGHRLFDPYHVRDYQSVFSTIDSRAIDGIEIYTGGFPVQFGDRMSGVMVMNSVDPDTPRHTEIGLSVFNTSFLTSIQNDDLQWILSARRGNLDLVIDKKFGQPKYYDVFSQLQYDIGNHSTLSANLLFADDVVSIVLETDPEEREEARSDTRNFQAWLQLSTDWSDELSSQTALSYVEYANERIAATSDIEKVVASVSDNRDITEFGIRQDWVFEPGNTHRIQWGYGASTNSAIYTYDGQAEYHGLPALFENQPASDMRRIDARPDGGRYFAYFADRWRLSPANILEIGLRWDDQTYASNDFDAQLSPRIGLLRHWNDRLDVRLSWGRYHQAQGIHELQVEDGVTNFWPAQRADHYIASIQYKFDGVLELRIETFHKRMQSVRPRFENLFDPLALIPEFQADRVRLEPSRATATGIELSLNGARGDFNWWSSYTLSRARDRIGGRSEARSWDQRHAFDAGISWSSDRWDVSLAMGSHSGWRTTDLMLVNVAGQAEPVAIPGPRNARKLGRFTSVDFRVNRLYETNRGRFSAFLEVSNMLNRRNICCVDWDISDVDNNLTLENSPDYWLPLLPAIGFLWEF